MRFGRHGVGDCGHRRGILIAWTGSIRAPRLRLLPRPASPYLRSVERKLYGKSASWPPNTPTTGNNPKSIVVASAAVDSQECEPKVWCVMVRTVMDASAFAAGDVPSARADITFGSEGGNTTVSVDVLNGVAINVIGHSVQVNVVDTTVYAGAPPSVSPFTFTGSVVLANVSTTSKKTLTVPMTVGTAVLVPPFAHKVSIERMGAALPLSTFVVEFRTINGNSVANFAVAAAGQFQDFYLGGQSYSVIVTASGADNSNFQAIFEIGL